MRFNIFCMICLLGCVICVFSFVFFFKQKTAYEMRISDWSSDVCSSDLAGAQEVGADALLQIARLADIQQIVGSAVHAIDARLRRQLGQKTAMVKAFGHRRVRIVDAMVLRRAGPKACSGGWGKKPPPYGCDQGWWWLDRHPTGGGARWEKPPRG